MCGENHITFYYLVWCGHSPALGNSSRAASVDTFVLYDVSQLPSSDA